MKRILFIGLLLLSSITAAADEVHYIGFNKFVSDKKSDSAASFDSYTRRLRPIMDRYGMSLEVFTVVHGGSALLAADAVTFGTAKNMETMGAFFQDPELQAIFPDLVAALSEHQVIFTSSQFSPGDSEEGHLLLSMDWMQDKENGIEDFHTLINSLEAVCKQFGVSKLSSTSGVMSNRGLAREITPVAAPDLLELWTMRDAHGYYDDLRVNNVNKKLMDIVSRTESFWLVPRSAG